jgi:hypothetical protein
MPHTNDFSLNPQNKPPQSVSFSYVSKDAKPAKIMEITLIGLKGGKTKQWWGCIRN